MITLRRFEESDAPAWDTFVRTRARNGTFLHTRRFLSHDARNAGDDASFLVTDGGNVVGVLPAALVRDGQDLVLSSHPRATYGGFVIDAGVGVATSLACVEQLVREGRQLGASRIVIRQPFRIFHRVPSDEIDFALWHHGFRTYYRELEVAVPLEGLLGRDILATYEHKTRNQTRKALKSGVQVRASEDYETFWGILEAALSARHAARPTHDLAAITRLRECVEPGEVRLFGAYLEGRMIAGMVVFVPNPLAVHAQYIAHDDAFASACPVNALVHHVIEWAASERYRYFNLGMATENRGRDVNLGLYRFKEAFGARGVLRETLSVSLEAEPTSTP